MAEIWHDNNSHRDGYTLFHATSCEIWKIWKIFCSWIHSQCWRWPIHVCWSLTWVTYHNDSCHYCINVSCFCVNSPAQWHSHWDSFIWIWCGGGQNISLSAHADRFSCRTVGDVPFTYDSFPACFSPRVYCWCYGWLSVYDALPIPVLIWEQSYYCPVYRLEEH